MFNEQDRIPALVAQLGDQLRQLGRFFRVHASRRLVQTKELGFGCHRSGDFQAAPVGI